MQLYQPTITGSLSVSGSINISGSINVVGGGGTITGTASYATNAELLDGLDSTVFTLTSSFAAQTASFTAFTSSVNTFTASINSFSASVLSYTSSLNAKTSSFATTGSNTFEGIQTINSNLIVTGSITAQTLVVQTITSSVDFVTGSTRFGSLSSNTHIITGSMYVTGAFYVTTGSVGIGTTNPQAILHIVSPVVASGTALKVVSDGNSSDKVFEFTGADGVATQTMVMLQTGNVGIGTTNPAYPLEISSATGNQLKMSTNDATSANNAGIFFYNESSATSSTRRSYMLLDPNGANAAGGDYAYFDMFGSGTARVMNQLTSGVLALGVGGTNIINITGSNVGIGTSSPNTISGYTILDIQNVTNGGLIQFGTNGTGYGRLFNNTAELQLRTIASIPLIFGTDNSERMRITSGGVVTVNQALSTYGTMAVKGNTDVYTYGGFNIYNNTNINFISIAINTTRAVIGADYAAGGSYMPLCFETGNTERMRITAGGTIQYFSGATLYGEIFIAGTAMAINGYNGDLNLQTSGANRLKINSSGWIGIDRTATANRLEVNGDASKTSAGSWLANSDINIKTDINTIEGALDRINKVRLVSFKYKDAYKEANNSIKDKYYHNVIAQEYQEIYPDYVYNSGDIFEENKVLQVDTNPMYIDSVSAIQELSKAIQELQAQITELKNK